MNCQLSIVHCQLLASGKQRVFRCASQTDIKFPVVGVDDGQCLAEIGTDDERVPLLVEQPRLRVMPGGSTGGECCQLLKIFFFHCFSFVCKCMKFPRQEIKIASAGK